jgi:prephenate dehydrogenase
MKPWNQVTIVGVGLIGGSLGLALKKANLAARIVGVGHRQASLDAARACGAADATTLDPAQGVRGSDLVVLATAVSKFRSLVEQMASALQKGAVVIDVGSVKARVVADLEPLVGPRAAFVGCHPIAGSEQRGIAHARDDLFAGEVCVLTPTERTPAAALERVAAMWKSLGMTVRTLSPEAHDRLLAEASHLPHVTAAALVTAISAEAESLVGPGWVDTTRVAGGDAALWRDILMANREEVARAIEKAEEVLGRFRDALERGQADRVFALLAAAKDRRDRLVQSRAGLPQTPNESR